MKLPKINETGVAQTLPLLLIVAAVGLISYLLISSTAPFSAGLFSILNPKPSSQAAGTVVMSQCTPRLSDDPTVKAAILGDIPAPGKAFPMWCYDSLNTGVRDTHVAGNNSWVDDFNHGALLSEFKDGQGGYRVFDTQNDKAIGAADKVIHWRHNNHWMVDSAGLGHNGPSSVMRPDMTFRAENGKLVIEAEAATRIPDYGGNLFWPEFVITTADHPGKPFPRTPSDPYQPEIRTNGTYVYETFPGSWTLGCRLQNDGGFTCALLDDSFDGDSQARVFELSHFQCGNGENSPHQTSVYGCRQKYGGHPNNLPTEIGGFTAPNTYKSGYTRLCAGTDPDVNCRDRWRWEITNDRLTWYANGAKYMEHWDFAPAGRAAIDQLLTRPVYVYFGQFSYRIVGPARMHWDRIAINPKDANGNILPPSAAANFCLGQPNNTCPAGPTPTPCTTNCPTSPPTLPPTPTPTASPTPPPAEPVPTPPSGGLTVSFNDRGMGDLLNQYPSTEINWGTSGLLEIAAPWKSFLTQNMGYTTNSTSSLSATFSILKNRRLVSIEALNGGTVASTVSIACTGNTTKTQSVAVNQRLTIPTGWTNNCSSAVTLSSTNGWNTNFDNIILSAVTTSTPTPTPTSTATPTPGTSLPGDISGPNGVPDGRVWTEDFNVIITQFGQTGPVGSLSGDISGPNGVRDGRVWTEDFNIIITNFGRRL